MGTDHERFWPYAAVQMCKNILAEGIRSTGNDLRLLECRSNLSLQIIKKSIGEGNE